ncbi:MAG: Fe-S protein assembly co-chaperone HscB [Acidobacteriota bacterium]|nr:Fe-S protein assembly co-chaperone HscB [Acidobacteriota bacterium]
MSVPDNYFDFFDLPHKLDIDLQDLEKRFYALSRRWHPDLFSRRSVDEQREALEASAILNDGYRVLRDPISRAEYLLQEQGFDTGEQKSKDVPAELLEEVFDLNMALDELRDGDTDAVPRLEDARGKFIEMRDEIDRELPRKFTEYDRSADREVLTGIRAILNRRKYIRNLVNEVEKALAVNVPN